MKMLKVNGIKDTKNPAVVTVELEEVLSVGDRMRGFSNPKKAFITADKAKMGFKEGMQVPGRILSQKVDGPQYEGHKEFVTPEGENKGYYKMEVIFE